MDASDWARVGGEDSTAVADSNLPEATKTRLLYACLVVGVLARDFPGVAHIVLRRARAMWGGS